jgi:hypothetical protein
MREEGGPKLKNRKKTEERFNKSESHTHSVIINSNMHGSDQLPQHPH